MTTIKTTKEDIFIYGRQEGMDYIQKVQGQQLKDHPDVYYVNLENGNYQLIDKPSGMLILKESNKKLLLEKWENKYKEMYEKLDRNHRSFKSQIEKFDKLVEEYNKLVEE